jgi:hypothetical protein
MDAEIDSGKSIEWPLGSVLIPAGFPAGSIGVIGWVESGGTTVYVPISVVPKGKPLPHSASTIAVFRSPMDLIEVRWRLWQAEAAGAPPQWQILGGDSPATFRAGDPIKIRLPSSASGALNLEAIGKAESSDEWPRAQLRVFLP